MLPQDPPRKRRPAGENLEDIATQIAQGNMRQQVFSELSDALGGAFSAEAEKASGVGEWVKFGARDTAKAFADGIGHTLALGTKLAFSATAMAEQRISGTLGTLFGERPSGFLPNDIIANDAAERGWAQAELALKHYLHTADPSAIDWMYAAMRPAGEAGLLGKGMQEGFRAREAQLEQAALVGDPDQMSVGAQVDKLLAKRLGDAKAFTSTAGTVASFVTGPGALLGRGGSAAVRPLMRAAENIVAKRLARGAIGGADPKVVGQILRSGNPLEALSRLPEWQAQAGHLKQLMGLGGRTISDSLTTGAGMVAQSYAMARNEERADAAWMAAVTAPLAVPMARIGQWFGHKVLTGTLRQDEAKIIGGIYQRMVDGEIGIRTADELIRKAVPMRGRELAANMIATAFEGTAMAFVQPAEDGHSMLELYDRWAQGDSDAGAEMAAMLFGSMVGTAMGRFGMREDLAPLFKHLRPSINTFRVRLETAALARRAQQDPRFLSRDALPTLPAADGRGGVAGETALVLHPETRRELDPEPIGTDLGVASSGQAMDSSTGTSMPRTRDTGEVVFFPQESLPSGLVESIRDADAQFGWAAGASEPLLQSGWEPNFSWDDSTILFQFGADPKDSVRARSAADGGMDLELSDHHRGVLADVGVEFPAGPLTGRDATRATDALTLLGQMRMMEAATTYERLGMSEVVPGVWADRGVNKQYRMALDGASWATDALGENPTRQPVVVAGGYGEPSFASPALAHFNMLALSKPVFAPNELVDGIFAQAQILAAHGDGVTAREMRRFFTEASPESLTYFFAPDKDEQFAYILGAIGSGHSNADVALADVAKLVAAEPPQAAIETQTPTLDATQEPAANPKKIRRKYQVDSTDPATMTRSAINKELDRLEFDSSKLTERAIANGRGDVKFSEMRKLAESGDAEALLIVQNADRQQALNQEIEARYGPNPPIRLPKGYGPRKRSSLADAHAKARLQEPTAVSEATKAVATADPAAPAELEAMMDKLMRLEELAQAYENKGNQDAANTLRDAASSGNRATIDSAIAKFGEASTQSGFPIFGRGGGKKALASVKRVADWIFADRLEVLRAHRDAPFIDEFRRARASARQISEEAAIRFDKAEVGLRKMRASAGQVVTIDNVPMYRWQALMEGRIEPATKHERAVADAGKDALLYLWEKAAGVGTRRRVEGSDGKPRWDLLDARDRAIVARVRGADWDAFTENPQHRADLWQWLAEHNPHLPLKAEDYEARFLERVTGKSVDSAEREAAFEFVREVKNFPAFFRGHQLLEANPFEAIHRIIQQQAGRIAATGEWGQGLPVSAREAIKLATGEVLGGGADEAAADYKKLLAKAPGGANRNLLRTVDDLLVTLQGGTPHEINPLLRALRPLEGLRRSSVTALSGLHDVLAPTVQGTAYSGFRRMVKALTQVARSPREMGMAARRAGVLMSEMGSHDFREAPNKLQRVADAVSWFSTHTERAKAVAFDRMASLMLEDWSAKRVTGNDRDVLRDMLLYSGEEQNSLLGGTADEALRVRFRQDFVNMATGRRSKAYGSQLHASPNLQAIIPFTNWITGRGIELARATRAIGRSGATLEERGRAIRRAMTLLGGWSATGVATTAMSYMIADAFKGENGADRFRREVAMLPWQQIAWNGLRGQIIGGPITSATRALGSDEGRDWASLTSVTALGWAASQGLRAATASAPAGLAGRLSGGMIPGADAASATISASGIVPTPVRDLAALLGGWIAGDDKTYRGISKKVSQFDTLKGRERPEFVRQKAPEFYDALAGIRRALQAHKDVPTDQRAKAAAEAAVKQIQEALGLASSDSVSSSIRAFQIMDRSDLADRAQLAEFLGDEDAALALDHDIAVRDLANLVARMRSEPQTALADDLANAERLAALGARDVWKPLAERASEDAALRIETGQPLGSELRDVAVALAKFPEHLSEVLSDREAFGVARQPSLGVRANYIATILRRRAHESITRRRRRDALDGAMEQRDGN